MTIDAAGVYYRDLNAMLRHEVARGARHLVLKNVIGQRYIGTDLRSKVQIDIYGVPGNDLGAFMDGPQIRVHGNAQDGCGNTMNGGEITVDGHAGDIMGFAMRGGRIFVKNEVGYRVGIHMKEYKKKSPLLVIGGTSQDFLGEYMAGGTVLLLGKDLKKGQAHRARFIGTGMHGGVIYIRGKFDDYQLGREVGVSELDDLDWRKVTDAVIDFSGRFDFDSKELLDRQNYRKLTPVSRRPYGRLYAY